MVAKVNNELIPKDNNAICVSGEYYGYVKGLFITSKKDKYNNDTSPYGAAADIKSLTKCKKDNLYEREVPDLEYDTFKNGGKDKFLKDNPSVFITSSTKYNLWNTKKGWTYGGGKNPDREFTSFTSKIHLLGKENTSIVMQESDDDHSNNEKVNFGYREKWDGDTLKISLIYQAEIHWKSGSIYNHAGIIMSTATAYCFINDGDSAWEIDALMAGGSGFISDGPGNFNVSLFGVEQLLDQIKSNKNTEEEIMLMYSMSYVGVGNTQGNTTNAVYNVLVLPASSLCLDSTAMMNGLVNGLGKMSMQVYPSGIQWQYSGKFGNDESEITEMPGIGDAKLAWGGVISFVAIYKNKKQ